MHFSRIGARSLLLSLGLAAAFNALPAHAAQWVSAAAHAVVDAADRDAADRAVDERRGSAQLLTFMQVQPGMAVLDLGAGGGHTTELLARAVGPTGVVYAQNNAMMLERFVKDKFAIRAAKPVMADVKHHVADFDNPIPPGARPLDRVSAVFIYHDTVWIKADRVKMNKALFAALKPGGKLILVDHAGNPGTGATQTDSLHRIEQSLVRSEIEAAGFRLEADADFLAHPDDPRDMPFFKATQAVDQFVLRFVKP